MQLDEEDKDDLDNIEVDTQPSGEDDDDDSEGDLREIGDIAAFEGTKQRENDAIDDRVAEHIEDANKDDEEARKDEVDAEKNANEGLTTDDPTNRDDEEARKDEVDVEKNANEGPTTDDPTNLQIKDAHAHGSSLSEGVQGRKLN